jgi:hypothetical protein
MTGNARPDRQEPVSALLKWEALANVARVSSEFGLALWATLAIAWRCPIDGDAVSSCTTGKAVSGDAVR